ncbi:7840_t:CDS:10 [Ambispora leptoticha]|uniref:7840_t:CDS:1 n=1 Tax=Ambispora leptoticha TaxID=144679 RepID=A0A9N8YSH3_9GLOM|nr:7840_t:CDS:10 [Ambispora leptoticha]
MTQDVLLTHQTRVLDDEKSTVTETDDDSSVTECSDSEPTMTTRSGLKRALPAGGARQGDAKRKDTKKRGTEIGGELNSSESVNQKTIAYNGKNSNINALAANAAVLLSNVSTATTNSNNHIVEGAAVNSVTAAQQALSNQQQFAEVLSAATSLANQITSPIAVAPLLNGQAAAIVTNDSGTTKRNTQLRNMSNDERRQRRLLRNRVAAKECRRKKKAYVADLEEKVNRLEEENIVLRKELEELKTKMTLGAMRIEEKSRLMKEVEELNGQLAMRTSATTVATTAQQTKNESENQESKSGLKEITSLLTKEIKELEEKIDAHDKQKLSQTHYTPFSEIDYTRIYEAISAPDFLTQNKNKLLSLEEKSKPSSPVANSKLGIPFLDTRIKDNQSSDAHLSIEDVKSMLNEAKSDNSVGALQNRLTLNIYEFNRLLGNCLKSKNIQDAENTLHLMEKAEILPDIITYDTLINLYANVRNVEKAISTFNLIESAGLKPSIHSYQNLIKAYCNELRLNEAFEVYEKIKSAGLIPSQAVFTALIKGCVDKGDIALAWKTFDYMRLEVCQPDEVTYSLMIHACAKTQEVERAFDLVQEMTEKKLYPTDAFNLLEQMQEQGFQPDRITYNTLIYACSKTINLKAARKLAKIMIESAKDKPLLAPTVVTFVNLFWVYAKDAFPFLPYEPYTQTQALMEVEMLFKYAVMMAQEVIQQQKNNSNNNSFMDNDDIIRISPILLDAYLKVIVKKGGFDKAMDIFTQKYAEFDQEYTGWTFITMLKTCYDHAKYNEAFNIWKAWQSWWKRIGAKYGNVGIYKMEIEFKKLGRTPEVRYQAYRWMINTLARCNDIESAMQLLEKLVLKGYKPNRKDLWTLYQKVIYFENPAARLQFLDYCRDQRTLTDEVNDALVRKWKGTTPFRTNTPFYNNREGNEKTRYIR